eukprot:m.191081 g.191081  ORF g.191081 m.191081 type:complete len:59 (+) comp14834_c0_seq1:259-435(+)
MPCKKTKTKTYDYKMTAVAEEVDREDVDRTSEAECDDHFHTMTRPSKEAAPVAIVSLS